MDQARRIKLAAQIGETGRDAARLASQHGGLGAAWMQVVHMDEGPARISPEEYRICVRWHLGVPQLPQVNGADASCPACHTPVDVYGDHLLCCWKNNFYGRHFAVQESLVAMAQAGDMAFAREAALPLSNQEPGTARDTLTSAPTS